MISVFFNLFVEHGTISYLNLPYLNAPIVPSNIVNSLSLSGYVSLYGVHLVTVNEVSCTVLVGHEGVRFRRVDRIHFTMDTKKNMYDKCLNEYVYRVNQKKVYALGELWKKKYVTVIQNYNVNLPIKNLV